MVGRFISITDFLALGSGLLIVILLINITVVLFIVLKWESEYVELFSDSLIKHQGILQRREQKYNCSFVEVITVEQSLLGMLFNYGTIELYDPQLKEQIYIVNIANPKKYREIIGERVAKARKHTTPIVV